MIQLENISKSYPDGTLFSNVNISLQRGVRAGLVGQNGSGKTTLLKMMLGKESTDSGNIKKEKNITIGYLEQEIIAGSGKSILEEVLASIPEAIKTEEKINSLSKKIKNDPNNMILIKKLGEYQNKFDSLGGWELKNKGETILSGLGFKKESFNEPLESFSGGWRMRVALAAILLKGPDILFLDEPTNHLDLDAAIWLETFLTSWKGSMIIISHDRTFLDRSVNQIIEIDLKHITLYHGNYSDYINEKKIRLDLHRNAYKNQQKEIKNTERFIDRFRSKNTKATQVQSRVKKLNKMKKVEIPTEDKSKINLIIPEPTRSPLKIASCVNIKKHYGDIEVFNTLDFEVERGQKIGLVGHNGAGKSTLLKMLAGVEKLTDGSIQFGENITKGYYAQHQLEILDPNETVYDSFRKVTKGWSETDSRTYLGSFMFTGDEIEKLVKVLSGGEKARLALARMLVVPSHLILLDEPTNHLDMVSRKILGKSLSLFKGSIVCISHDRHFLNEVTNMTCEVGNGSVKTFNGNYDYYEWKTKDKNKISLKVNNQKKNKNNYKDAKKIRNRINWIEKRFFKIEESINELQITINNPENISNHELLKNNLNEVNELENEYFSLIEEKELINKELQ
jgi:ATP-binding cassette subfamily F protein 3